MHTPVLLNEAINLLEPKSGENFIDGTFGGGGHSRAILRKIGPSGRLLAVDWNKQAVDQCRANYRGSTLIDCAEGNFADLPEIMKQKKFPPADGLLLDLGVSSGELEKSGRGFSFQKDEPLLMTYNDQQKPVCQILAEVNEEQLAEIIRQYGEERFAGRIARVIKEYQRRRQMKTTKDLTEAVIAAVPAAYRRGRPRPVRNRTRNASVISYGIHPATRTFMALRIYANQELENLQTILNDLEEILDPGGRAAIISFHSLEDRLVKQKFRELAKSGKAELLVKKPIRPDREEIVANPRARSAKLRAVKLI